MTNVVPLGFALLCGGVFVLALGTIGVFLVLYAVRSRKKAAASQAWPTAQGWITQSQVKQSASTDDEGRTRYAYYPTVVYEYVVADQTYSGKQISFGGVKGSSAPDKAQAALAPYPPGGQVSVIYNPENPAEAVLQRGAGAANWALGGGIFCLVLVVCIACPLAIGVVRNWLPGLGR